MDQLQRIRAVVSDVDGVLSDGSIIVGAHETKVFSVRDGMGVKLLQKAGIAVALLSGRVSEPTNRRARELGITEVVTGRNDKQDALLEMAERLGIPPEEMAYVGDDLPDLAPLAMAGAGFCPADAVPEVLAAADFVVPVRGGRGVLRHVAETLLKARGEWAAIVAGFGVRS